MKKILFLSIVISQYAFSENITTLQSSDIHTLRTHTSLHANQAARNIVIAKINGLKDGCTEGVFFPEENNQTMVSLILSAKISNQNIRIAYEPTVHAPWGSTKICALTYFDIL